jgi:hypothetical protein
MRGRRFLHVLKVLAIVIVALTVVGFVVSNLWNYLMPGLFSVHTITFWQAVGLIVLARLLFGGFRPGFGGGPWKRRMIERWEQMTPEEREKFRQGLGGRCGASRVAPPAPTGGPAA